MCVSTGSVSRKTGVGYLDNHFSSCLCGAAGSDETETRACLVYSLLACVFESSGSIERDMYGVAE